MRSKRERASSPSFVHDQSSGKGRLEAAPGRRMTIDAENRFNAVPERRIADKTEGMLRSTTELTRAIDMAELVKRIDSLARAKSEQKTVVRYETVEERRLAMIAKGWSSAGLDAMEAAMEPKFIQEQRKKEELRAALRERGIDPDILEAPPDVLAAIRLKFLEYKKPDPVQ